MVVKEGIPLNFLVPFYSAAHTRDTHGSGVDGSKWLERVPFWHEIRVRIPVDGEVGGRALKIV